MAFHPAPSSAHDKTYVDGSALTFPAHVSTLVDVASAALEVAAPPNAIIGAIMRAATSAAVAREEFLVMLPSFLIVEPPLCHCMSGPLRDLPTISPANGRFERPAISLVSK